LKSFFSACVLGETEIASHPKACMTSGDGRGRGSFLDLHHLYRDSLRDVCQVRDSDDAAEMRILSLSGADA
jgi:hypothetical protein